MGHATKTNYLTVQEISKVLRLSALTIYKYIRERKLSVVEFGGHYRISHESLNEFIENHKIGTAENIEKKGGTKS